MKDLTVSAGRLVSLVGTVPSDLHILHHIAAGAASGGYVSARVCTKQKGAALAETPKPITAMSRVAATNIVTADCLAHGLSVGDIAVIVDAGTFTGEFQVATTADADHFTFLQAGANEGPVTGKVHRIPTVAYNGEGANLKSAVTTTGYHCRIANFNGVLWLQVNITDGTHNVTWQQARAGTGAQNQGETAAAVLGTTADAAVVTDAAGTISAKLRGLVKWAFERMPASLGQKAKAASLPVTLASDEDPLRAGGLGDDFVATPVITAGPAVFAAGDAIGALVTLTNIARAAGKAVIIQNLVVADKALQSKGMEVIFFNANPSASTITDNLAMSIADADVGKIVAIRRVYASDYVSLTASSAAQPSIEPVHLTPADASRDLYLAVRASEAINPGFTTGDVQVTLNLLRD